MTFGTFISTFLSFLGKTTYDNRVMALLIPMSKPWSKRSDVTLNPSEAAYRVQLQNGNKISSNLRKMFVERTAVTDGKAWKKVQLFFSS